LLYAAHSQNAGIRLTSEFSDNKIVNYSTGFGGYLNIDGFSDHFELMFSLDYNKNDRRWEDSEIQTTYSRYNFSMKGMYVHPFTEKLKLKTGPGMCYSKLNYTYGGLGANWIETGKGKTLGAEWMANLYLEDVFKLPLNLELFITPSYMFNLEMPVDPTLAVANLKKGLIIVNLQFGISYQMDN